MKSIPRPESVITGRRNLELLQCLPNFPVFIGTTEQAPEQDLFGDMDWYICRDSGVIQLTSLLSPDVVYSSYHSEAIGAVWKQHHDRFVDFCGRYALQNVLEIGGSNGYIAERYIEQHGPVGWTIVEPNLRFKGNEHIQVVEGFFESSMLNSGYQAIVHSHVLEHTANPDRFLQEVSQSLSEGQPQVFSVPNLYRYLLNRFSNTINFEHTYLLTEELLDYLLAKNCFETIEKHYFDDHSIFYATRKNRQAKPVPLVNRYQEYKTLYQEFFSYFQNEVARLNHLIENFSGPVYLFGAHIFSQFLLYLGLNAGKVDKILDNSREKNKKRLYGTALRVGPPEAIGDLAPVAVILKAGQYQDEVRRQLLSINPQVEIWE